jgi:HAMP domain-containing protein
MLTDANMLAIAATVSGLLGAAVGYMGGWMGAKSRVEAHVGTLHELGKDVADMKREVVWEKTCEQCRKNLSNQIGTINTGLGEVREELGRLAREVTALPERIRKDLREDMRAADTG